MRKSESFANILLNHVNETALALLQPDLKIVEFERGDVLYEAGDEVEDVYFPHDGLLSLLFVTKNGRFVETGSLGRDGVLGAMAGLNNYFSSVRVVAQLPLTASVISAGRFRKAVKNNNSLATMCIQYNEVLLSQARMSVACNALHTMDRRLCHRLLEYSDRAGSLTLTLTQEQLANLLAVRRTTITEVAGKLKRAKIISFARGTIQIIDREALERRACECQHGPINQHLEYNKYSGKHDANGRHVDGPDN